MCKKLAILPVFSIIMAFMFPRQALASYPNSTLQKLVFSVDSNLELNDGGFIVNIEKEPKLEASNADLEEKAEQIKQETVKKAASVSKTIACSETDLALGTCKTFKVAVTGYSSTVDQCDADPFTTASGKHVHPGTLAANFLPFGTLVKFPGYFGDRVFIVEDRMNKRFSDRMDVWFESRREALEFGKRTLTAVVIK